MSILFTSIGFVHNELKTKKTKLLLQNKVRYFISNVVDELSLILNEYTTYSGGNRTCKSRNLNIKSGPSLKKGNHKCIIKIKN